MFEEVQPFLFTSFYMSNSATGLLAKVSANWSWFAFSEKKPAEYQKTVGKNGNYPCNKHQKSRQDLNQSSSALSLNKPY